MRVKMRPVVARCLIVGGEQILQHRDCVSAAMSGI
jgi:hypothetical protein